MSKNSKATKMDAASNVLIGGFVTNTLNRINVLPTEFISVNFPKKTRSLWTILINVSEVLNVIMEI